MLYLLRFIFKCAYKYNKLQLNYLGCVIYSLCLFLGSVSNTSCLSYISVSILLNIFSSIILLRSLDIFIVAQTGVCVFKAYSMYILDSFSLHILLSSVELISYLFRSCSLGFRYTANAITGHLLVHILNSCVCIHNIFSCAGSSMLSLLDLFEYLVVVVQSSILTMLLYVYLNLL